MIGNTPLFASMGLVRAFSTAFINSVAPKGFDKHRDAPRCESSFVNDLTVIPGHVDDGQLHTGTHQLAANLNS